MSVNGTYNNFIIEIYFFNDDLLLLLCPSDTVFIICFVSWLVDRHLTGGNTYRSHHEYVHIDLLNNIQSGAMN